MLDTVKPLENGQPATPLAERLSVLIRAIREAENPTRTSVQALSTGTTASSDRRAVSQLVQPLPGLAEAGALSLTVEGQYLTRDGFIQFLSAAQSVGGAISTLLIQDNRFKTTITLYART